MLVTHLCGKHEVVDTDGLRQWWKNKSVVSQNYRKRLLSHPKHTEYFWKLTKCVQSCLKIKSCCVNAFWRAVSFLLSALGAWWRKPYCTENCANLRIIIHCSILFCQPVLFWKKYEAKFWNQIIFSSLKCSLIAISNCRSNRKQANVIILGPQSHVIIGKEITAAISSPLRFLFITNLIAFSLDFL